MNEKTRTTGLVQTWVSVTDAQGRTRLEARWVPATHAAQVVHAA